LAVGATHFCELFSVFTRAFIYIGLETLSTTPQSSQFDID